MVRNVLLITVDSLRADYVLQQGEAPESTTNMTQVAADGTSFESAFATGPGTTPSFPAMLTGTLPLSYDGLGPLGPDRPRVARNLRDAGLTTGAFQCNPFLSSHFDYDVGYDTFEDYQNPLMGIATRIFPRGIELNNPKLRKVDDVFHITDIIKKSYKLVKGKPRPYVSARVITDDTLAWLSETDAPFFCWTHYMDVHHPCFPPAEYREAYDVADVTQSQVSEWYSSLLGNPETITAEEMETLRRLYAAAIDYVDDQIGRIVDHLVERDRYEETLVIVTSDHGELFGEHGQYGKPERMCDELLRVPLLIANGPEYLDEASDDLTSLLDIPPLIHETLGLDVPAEYEGRIPGKDSPREFVLAEHDVEGDVVVGARSKDWLFEADEIRDERRLFDLRDDGFERVPVESHADETAVVRNPVLQRLERLDVETGQFETELRDDVESRLEDLGYL